MQLRVPQTITSTENNYKAIVNFTGDYSYRRSASEPKISKIPTKKEYNMKASSLTPRKTEKLQIHISTAYKDYKKYTVYKVENVEKIPSDMFCTLKITFQTKTIFQIG